ncbi:MAG: LysR family transcriptional regulator [Desulfobacteraceae bacterium]|nr:LysR family transcriptional regulator [Desulfobacteraceae bacterium]
MWGFTMDLYQLKTFFTLGKVKSYTGTAAVLHVTQSAVSHAVKKLETSVETGLIQKKGKDFKLTAAGQILFRSCEMIFTEIENVRDTLKVHTQNAFRHIYLGSPVEFGTTILIRHIREFMETNPLFHLDFLFSHNLREPLVSDEVDFIIDCNDHPLPGTEKIFLFREQYVTICSPDYRDRHRIAGVTDLQRVHILSMDTETVWWKNFIITLPPEMRLILKNVIQINHVRGIINGAINGLGIGFVPKYTVINELKTGLLVNPFPDIIPAADHFNIFIKRHKLRLEKNKTLIGFLTRLQPVEFGAEIMENNYTLT